MSQQQLKEKREALGKVWEEYRKFRDKLPDNPDEWTAEINEKYEKFDADIDKLDRQIGSIERDIKDAEREKRFKAPETEERENFNVPVEKTESDDSEQRKSEAFDKLLRGGLPALNQEERNMFAGSDIGGGYLITPEKFVGGMLKNVDDQVKIRGLATVHQLKKAASMGVITFDNDLDDWGWTTELATGALDTGVEFGKRDLAAYPMAKRIKLSETLLRLSNRDVQSIVRDRMAYKLGGTMEQAYMTGTGHKQPIGLFTVSSDGIPATRDVATDNTATVLKADNLIEVQGTLKDAYQGKARWLFHRDAITKLRKLKSSDNQYLWTPGLSDGVGSRILGKPYVLSEWCPNTFTANQYVGMYGDFSYYWIVDCLNMQIKVLKELYAETNQIGFIGRYEGDGQPVLAEAFVRIKMGS